ncbi:unnamed protein product [Larinioides sclopetarius]|uniref:Chitin-binding type-2 domain-containing protein n=1 Tax=Larinioides sclopetarius TaxID=280406 RepID=A0AAV1YRB9_9ARAC
MSRNRTMSFLISAVIFVLAVGTNGVAERAKRQAPNINVHDIPKTSFSCADKKIGEYYADAESYCQVYHVCVPGMNNKASLISFVCPNGTIFNQATKVCTPFERVDCKLTKFHEASIIPDNIADTDDDYDNYVPPPRQPAQPARQSSSSRSRNTPAPPPPPPPAREAQPQPPRNTRFRSGSNQFRGGQAATTQAPSRTSAAPPQPARAPAAPARPAPLAFRTPVLAARPPQTVPLANALPARPTVRAVVSTSTASYNYDYEYEYDYENDANEEGGARTKREVRASEEFTCEGKVPGGAYADVESNCEMFHICVLLGKNKVLDYKVYCANGTAFDQETGSCREKGEFTCENAHLFFQFEKPNQPKSTKKPVISKKKVLKSKKISNSDKE